MVCQIFSNQTPSPTKKMKNWLISWKNHENYHTQKLNQLKQLSRLESCHPFQEKNLKLHRGLALGRFDRSVTLLCSFSAKQSAFWEVIDPWEKKVYIYTKCRNVYIHQYMIVHIYGWCWISPPYQFSDEDDYSNNWTSHLCILYPASNCYADHQCPTRL